MIQMVFDSTSEDMVREYISKIQKFPSDGLEGLGFQFRKQFQQMI